MRDILSKHNIPTGTLAEAVEFLNGASATALDKFNREFGLTPEPGDALSVARFAADAIFKGAGAVDKVVGYVAKRMIGLNPVVDNPAPVKVVGVPVVETNEVVVAPIVDPSPSTATVKVRGKAGRKRLGNSDMCKAVAAIEAAQGSDRRTILDCIVAQGIKESSAVVYLWRYNKGERE